MYQRSTGSGHGFKGGKMYAKSSIQMVAVSQLVSMPASRRLNVIGHYFGVIAC